MAAILASNYKWLWIILIIIGILIVLFVLVVLFFALMSYFNRPQKQDASKSDAPILYTNKTYGYSITYPGNWFIDTYSADDTTALSEDAIISKVVWSNYDCGVCIGEIGETPKDLTYFKLMTYNNTGALKDWVNKLTFLKKETLKDYKTKDGLVGFEYQTYYDIKPSGFVEAQYIAFQKNNIVFLFSYINADPEKHIDPTTIKELEDFVSTFKFTN